MNPRRNTRKPKYSTRTLPYLSPDHLTEIADRGDEWDFNRQLCPEAVRELLSEGHEIYPVVHELPHRHRRFQPCEPHVRVVFETGGAIGIADVPTDYARDLPRLLTVMRSGEYAGGVLIRPNGEPHTFLCPDSDPPKEIRRTLKHLARKSRDGRMRAFVRRCLTSTALRAV
ncbi:hypothetical protein [Alienimonas sp. DA493]|uniref:hypothetical protein n=1 Tax=Alienimonas sp. DA493 TaxID=3373605 RepID=UPI00375418E2